MAKNKLTLSVDEGVVERAKRFASEESGLSVSALVEAFLDDVGERADRTPPMDEAHADEALAALSAPEIVLASGSAPCDEEMRRMASFLVDGTLILTTDVDVVAASLIRARIRRAGFAIVREVVVPVESLARFRALRGPAGHGRTLLGRILDLAAREGAQQVHLVYDDPDLHVRSRRDGFWTRRETLTESDARAVFDACRNVSPERSEQRVSLDDAGVASSIHPHLGLTVLRSRALEQPRAMFSLRHMDKVAESRSIVRRPGSLESVQKAARHSSGINLVASPVGHPRRDLLASIVAHAARKLLFNGRTVFHLHDGMDQPIQGAERITVDPSVSGSIQSALGDALRMGAEVVALPSFQGVEQTETRLRVVDAALRGVQFWSTVEAGSMHDMTPILNRMQMGRESGLHEIKAMETRTGRMLCRWCRTPTMLWAPAEDHRLHGIRVFRERQRAIQTGTAHDGSAWREPSSLACFDADPDGCPRCSGGYEGTFLVCSGLNDVHTDVNKGWEEMSDACRDAVVECRTSLDETRRILA